MFFGSLAIAGADVRRKQGMFTSSCCDFCFIFY